MDPVLPTITPIQVIAQAENLLPEVLGQIFEWVVAQGLKKGWMDKKERGELIHLTLVCKWWREVALLTRHLWGGVEVYSAFKPTKPFRLPAKGLNLWFERAGDSRKSLTITAGQFVSDEPCTRHREYGLEDVDKICRLHYVLAFLKTGPPFHGLRIEGQSRLCLNALMSGLRDSASPSWDSIQRLPWSISDTDYFNDSRRKCPVTLAILPPSLTSLSLFISLPSDDHMQVTGQIVPAALNRLTSLVITSRKDLSPMASLLQHCISLQHLSISQSGGHNYHPADALSKDKEILFRHAPISLPHLQSLNLNMQPPSHVNEFFRLFRTPNLESIRTRHERNTEPEERYLWNSLHSLHLFTPGDLRPAIQNLTLFARSIPPAEIPANELYDILSDLPPSLRQLKLENLTFDAGELLALHQTRATSANASRLLPSLQYFEIADPGSQFDLGSFLDLVKGSPGTPPLPGAFTALRRIDFTFSLWDVCEYEDGLFIQQYRDEATLRELETSFGIVVDLVVVTTWAY